MKPSVFNIEDVYFSYYGVYKEINGKGTIERLKYGLPYIMVNKVNTPMYGENEIRFENTFGTGNTLYLQFDVHKGKIENNSIIIGPLGSIYSYLTEEERNNRKISKIRIQEIYYLLNSNIVKEQKDSNVLPFKPKL